jgi:CheY-like chemotaxis protein
MACGDHCCAERTTSSRNNIVACVKPIAYEKGKPVDKEKFKMPKKIMIVEDDPMTMRYLQAVFSDNGYATCAASNSTEALDLVIQEKPDLITLDLQLPDEWGPRFYRKLRKMKELKDIPIIVISGIDGDHAIKDAIAFIDKPFDPEKLIGIVKNTIG